MKYAVLNPQGGINRISDTEPQNTPEGTTVVEITDEQVATVQAGKKSEPAVRYFLIEGKLKTMAEKQEIAQAARLAERAASMTQAEKIKAAEAHIEKYFTAFGLMEGLKKLLTAQATDKLDAIPKTLAVAAWVETVKGMALAGQLNFPPAPHTFEEVVTE
jgi:hypothetical protein